MSSSGSPMMAINWPRGADSPSWIRILRSTPLLSACIFIVALSVSISANGSPIETLSPSFLSHRESWPSSMVGESLGMITLVAIQIGPLQVSNFAHRRDDLVHSWNSAILEVLRIRHRHVGGRDSFDRRIKIVERTLGDFSSNLRPDSAKR